MDDIVFAAPLAAMLSLLPRAYNAIIASRDSYLLDSLLECCALVGAQGSGAQGSRNAQCAGEQSGVESVAPQSSSALRISRVTGDTAADTGASVGLRARDGGVGEGGADGSERSVVAVVGLLHVNGMARRFLQGQRPGTAATPRAVWISKSQDSFVPPTGYVWACESGQVWSCRVRML